MDQQVLKVSRLTYLRISIGLIELWVCVRVPRPTRENDILDVVISSEVSMVEELKVLEHFSTSDHNMGRV